MKLKIAKVRTAKKISMRQLELKSGVAHGYISELERGVYENPSVGVL
jgi:transcriptional regulator with XRE-family HTH domain